MNERFSLPDYQPERFVNRQEEIEKAQALAQKILRGDSLRTRTLVFTGMRAVGKTWLLKHLGGLLEDLGFRVVYVNLKDFAGRTPSSVVVEVLQQLYRDFVAYNSQTTQLPFEWSDMADLSRKVMSAVRSKLQQDYLCLCLDHVYETDWALLPDLEEFVLAPLAIEARVMLVLAGRGRGFQFKTPELWFAETKELQPFNEANLKEQLSKVQLGFTEQITELSAGSPGAAYVLATLNDAQLALITMLDVLPEQDRAKAQEYLKALCVLQVFDDLRIARMVRVYRNSDDDLSMQDAREIREALIRWGFATWDTAKGGYVLQPVLRKLAEEALREKQQDLWKSLHEAAISLYNEWVNQYPRGKSYWEQEKTYHCQFVSENEKCPVH